MFRCRMFCSLDLLVIFLQFFAAVSAATIDYPGRSLHSDHSHEKAAKFERTLSARDAKIAPGLDRPTLLVAKENQSRYVILLLTYILDYYNRERADMGPTALHLRNGLSSTMVDLLISSLGLET